MNAINQSSPISDHASASSRCAARLVIEAQCSTCGPIWSDRPDQIEPVQLALEHTRSTGHVVVLNGTTDLPDHEQSTTATLTSSRRDKERGARDSAFYVDLPTTDCINNDDGSWVEAARFRTREEAISFAQEHFGADAEGKVRLISR